MSWPTHGTTNAPGTCLWCGRKLRRPHHVERNDGSGKKPRRCSVRSDFLYDKGEPCGSTNIHLSGLGWTCDRGHHINAPRGIVKRTPVYDKPGDYGDGHFCGLRCGYMFGRALANVGRRLVTREQRG